MFFSQPMLFSCCCPLSPHTDGHWPCLHSPLWTANQSYMPGECSFYFNLLILRSQWRCSGSFLWELWLNAHCLWVCLFYTSLLHPSHRQVATISGLGIRADMLCPHWNWIWKDSHPQLVTGNLGITQEVLRWTFPWTMLFQEHLSVTYSLNPV